MTVEHYVRAAQRGDPAAMSALIAELAPWVARICGSIALDRGDDALQETMIAVLRNLVTLRDARALRAWVRRIAVRESLRVASRGRATPMAELPEAPPPDIDLDEALDVRATLDSISPQHRAVLVLRHAEDLSEEETAQLLGVEPGTVKSRANRAKQAFAKRWKP
jgi:RNA polymerase sigma-70 factor (ECF subfamily)